MPTSDAVLMDHVHGVANNRCSHADCQRAFTHWSKQRRLDQRRGVRRTVDADPARAQLARLEGAGWSRRAIAGAAGVSPAAISRIALGQRTVRTGVLRKLDAIDPASLPQEPAKGSDHVFVPRIGTVRRIQALLALGWTHAHITEAAGVKTPVLLTQIGRWVSRPTHDKVAAAYRELSRREGPSALTRTRAARLGYLSPAAWDDIDLDAEPEIDDTTDRRSSWSGAALIEDYAHLASTGLDRQSCADRLGVSRDALDKAIQRHQRRSDETRNAS